jgi:hypothetical protein
MPFCTDLTMISTPSFTTPSTQPRLELIQRSPQRLSVTVSHHLFQILQDRSDYEGRSMSNLAAFLLEQGLNRAS